MQPNAIQSDFYQSQQTRFQQVEPNRILGRRIAGQGDTPLGLPFVLGATQLLSSYDPYTGKTTPRINSDAVNQIFTGQDDTTEQERQCRSYIGLTGLRQLVREQSADPYAPVRCGWRYKPSTSGPIAQVAQGALGTIQGPLNTNAPEDSLGNGVEWIWNLRKAEQRQTTDIARQLGGRNGFSLVGDVAGGAFRDQFGYCTTTDTVIPLSNGRPLYPDNPTMNCAVENIITDPAKLPPRPGSVSGPAAFVDSRIQPTVECATTRDPLTRDCLLQAVTMNGCSDKGSLYMALQMANPTGRWDDFLAKQNAFTTYQSKQGSSKITENLFRRNASRWETAVNEVTRLNNAAQRAADRKTLIAARDLCYNAGEFDTYDFCSDIPENTRIGDVDLVCLQNYWQNSGGKPEGKLYPNSVFVTSPPSIIGAGMTWNTYKSAVDNLKKNTTAENAAQQRQAVLDFYGVQTRLTPFRPTLPSLALWLDATDGARLTVTSSSDVSIWQDKSRSDGARNLTQTDALSRPKYIGNLLNGKPGIFFNGRQFLNFTDIESSVTGSSGFTIFVVEQRATNNNRNYFLGGTKSILNQSLYAGYRTNTRSLFSTDDNDAEGPLPSFSTYNSMSVQATPTVKRNLDTPRIWTMVSRSTGKVLRINGTLNAQDNSTKLIRSWKGAALGASSMPINPDYYTGVIYEVLIFNQALADADMQQVEAYLATNWGILSLLDSNHPYKTTGIGI